MDDYTFQYNEGVVLNEDFAPGVPFVDVQGVTGLDSGEFRITDRTREGADGGFLDTGYKEMRTIVIDAVVYGDESYLETLKANWRPYREGTDAVGGGAIFRWSVDGLNRMVRGRSLGMKYDWDEMRRTGRCTAQFQLKCEDPTIYADPARVLGPITLTSSGTSGYAYNRTYNRTYGGGTGGGGSLSIYNFGTRDTYPDIHIEGPCTNPFVINDAWPSLRLPILRFIGTLGEDDFLDISTRLRTVTLNSSTSRRAWLSTPYVWWGLVPGDNFVRFGADTYTAAEATLTVYDAYE